jgi:hypothetical protein
MEKKRHRELGMDHMSALPAQCSRQHLIRLRYKAKYCGAFDFHSQVRSNPIFQAPHGCVILG